MEFAMVHHSVDHIEIVNISRHPPDWHNYLELEVRCRDAPNTVIFCKKDCVEQVLATYHKEKDA